MVLSKSNIQKLVSQHTRGRYTFQPLWVSGSTEPAGSGSTEPASQLSDTDLKYRRRQRVPSSIFVKRVLLTELAEQVLIIVQIYLQVGGGRYCLSISRFIHCPCKMCSCFRSSTAFPVVQFNSKFSRIFSQSASREHLRISAVLKMAQTFGCKQHNNTGPLRLDRRISLI